MRCGFFVYVVIALGSFWAGCDQAPMAPAAGTRQAGGTGGDDAVLRVAVPREPSTWNRLLVSDVVTQIVADQLHAPLLRLNPQTQEMEGALAQSWAFSDDGSELVFKLREGLRFSDGEPFTADDVVFTFRALADPRVASPLKDAAVIDGKPLVAEALDDTVVRFRLPRRTGALERIFDSIRILPEHVLSESLEAGTLARDSGLGAPIASVVGLGPFRLREHLPGESVVLEKNPHYFRADEGLPRLSRIVFEVLPDENVQVLRLRSGELDLVEPLGSDAFAELRGEDSDAFVLHDLGPSLVAERFWFNLNPASPIEDYKKRWFADVRFRRAVSLAIDRDNLARVVFGGLASPASGPVSPANRFWKDETVLETKRDLEQARALLVDAGFVSVEGKLHDEDGHPVRFTIVTNSDSAQRRREAAFLQEDLSQLGMDAVLAPIDGSTMFAAITTTFDYEASLLGFTASDPDPSAEMELWLSRGPFHLWHPSQATPATAWEARIDELMESQMASIDPEHRRACYHEVQHIVAEQLPLLHLVVPHALVGYSARLHGVRATPLSHSLWNSEELYMK
jgi:peptide/nickel transport system substrate-binding protein